jgi:hypothetical protein
MSRPRPRPLATHTIQTIATVLLRPQVRQISVNGHNFLLRLKRRCEELRFPADDPLRVLATNAYDAAWRLSLEIHSRSVSMGGGRRP